MLPLIISLFAAGFLMLLVELFIPGGIVGIFGGLVILAGVILSFVEFGFITGSLILIGACILAFLMFLWWLRHFPDSYIGKKLTLGAAVSGRTEHPDNSELVGAEGKALTQLRPAGVAHIAARRVDVVTEGEFVSAGDAVKVIWCEGARVVVRRILPAP